MNLYLRFLMVLIGSFFRPRISDILALSCLRLRVLPNDLDLNGHMNNGRYPSLMDLGRLDLVLRSGLLRLMLREKSVPILAAVQIRFRIPLEVFQAYDLETRVICWDDKWVFMEQRFVIAHGEKAGGIAAIALVKGNFYDRRAKNTWPTQALLKALGAHTASPAFPDYITRWMEAEESMRVLTRKNPV
jgi:acyl-CoA thioesterase FadM